MKPVKLYVNRHNGLKLFVFVKESFINEKGENRYLALFENYKPFNTSIKNLKKNYILEIDPTTEDLKKLGYMQNN